MKKFTLTALALCLPLSAFAAESPGAHFIENWDLNGDGTVSLEDLTEKRGDVFYMFDQDENDVLDAKEYVLFDETRAADMAENAGAHGGGQGGKRMQEGLTLSFNDTDGDGQVSRAEFLEKSKAWFAVIDRNADGVVDVDDFGPRAN